MVLVAVVLRVYRVEVVIEGRIEALGEGVLGAVVLGMGADSSSLLGSRGVVVFFAPSTACQAVNYSQ